MEQKGGKQLVLGCILALLLVPASLFSQNNTQKWGVSASAMGGYVWAHTGQTTNLKAHTYGFIIGYKHKTANKKQWQRLLNSPSWGVNYLYLNYGKPNILGAAHAILTYMDFPIARKKYFELNIRGTTGLGFITKIFDVKHNVVNRSIGSHINPNMGLFLSGNIFVTKHAEINLLYGLTHFSNANFIKPNLGVNTPNINLGITYYFGTNEIIKPNPDDLDTTRNEYRFSLALGKKNIDYIYPRVIIIYGLQFKYLRALSIKNKIGGGIDLFYDKDNFYTNHLNGDIKDAKIKDVTEIGIKVSHELQGKRLSLVTDIGYYLYNTNSLKGKVYQRIGFNYLINKNFSTFICLKANKSAADYFEFGLHYSIRR